MLELKTERGVGPSASERFYSRAVLPPHHLCHGSPWFVTTVFPERGRSSSFMRRHLQSPCRPKPRLDRVSRGTGVKRTRTWGGRREQEVPMNIARLDWIVSQVLLHLTAIGLIAG